MKTKFRSKTAITFDVELTDTFGGEANYCWVRRAALTVPDDISDRALMRLAKAAVGMTGARGRVSQLGEVVEFRPYRLLQVMFVAPRY